MFFLKFNFVNLHWTKFSEWFSSSFLSMISLKLQIFLFTCILWIMKQIRCKKDTFKIHYSTSFVVLELHSIFLLFPLALQIVQGKKTAQSNFHRVQFNFNPVVRFDIFPLYRMLIKKIHFTLYAESSWSIKSMTESRSLYP